MHEKTAILHFQGKFVFQKKN